jgi:hypothetical protein
MPVKPCGRGDTSLPVHRIVKLAGPVVTWYLEYIVVLPYTTFSTQIPTRSRTSSCAAARTAEKPMKSVAHSHSATVDVTFPDSMAFLPFT